MTFALRGRSVKHVFAANSLCSAWHEMLLESLGKSQEHVLCSIFWVTEMTPRRGRWCEPSMPSMPKHAMDIWMWPRTANDCLGPPIVPFYTFLGEGSPTEKKGYPYSNLSTGGPSCWLFPKEPRLYDEMCLTGKGCLVNRQNYVLLVFMFSSTTETSVSLLRC